MILAVSIAFLIRKYVLEAYQIPSLSMKPTLLSGDTIFVGKWPPWLQKGHFPERGDIVVFSGSEENGMMRRDYVKRVMGLPGDELSLNQGALYLNHEKLEIRQDPLGSESCGTERLPSTKEYRICKDDRFLSDFGPERVPAGSVLVMGDYRTDSRADFLGNNKGKPWSIVALSALKGKALWIWLSIDPSKSPAQSSTQSQKGRLFNLPFLRFDRMFRRIE